MHGYNNCAPPRLANDTYFSKNGSETGARFAPRAAISPWCERRDSNPHALRRQNLNLVRLPIPPLSRLSNCNIISYALKACKLS